MYVLTIDDYKNVEVYDYDSRRYVTFEGDLIDFVRANYGMFYLANLLESRGICHIPAFWKGLFDNKYLVKTKVSNIQSLFIKPNNFGCYDFSVALFEFDFNTNRYLGSVAKVHQSYDNKELAVYGASGLRFCAKQMYNCLSLVKKTTAGLIYHGVACKDGRWGYSFRVQFRFVLVDIFNGDIIDEFSLKKAMFCGEE